MSDNEKLFQLNQYVDFTSDNSKEYPIWLTENIWENHLDALLHIIDENF